jgi:hypothetical protein
VDGRSTRKSARLIGGYVFFLTSGDDYAGIPDILGVYRVLTEPGRDACRVPSTEIRRLVLVAHDHDETLPRSIYEILPAARAYIRSAVTKSRKPRASKRARSGTHA